jgi:hypothetical protein
MSANAAPDLRIRIWRTVVPASDKAAVSAAIADANARSQSLGLPDALNPNAIDPAKAEALISALTRPPGDALAPLAGRVLYFDPIALRIATSSPTTVASFANPVSLQVTHDHSEMVSARVVMTVDCGIARDRAAEARRRTEEADRAVKAAHGDGVMPAQLRRQALSRVWLDNASAHAACSPSDASASADAAEADRMMKASIVLGGRME